MSSFDVVDDNWHIIRAEQYNFPINVEPLQEDVDEVIGDGVTFESKGKVKKAVAGYIMKNKFQIRTRRSNSKVVHIVCKVPDCRWKVRAVKLDSCGL